MIEEKTDGIIKSLSDECERLQKENRLLRDKLSVAIEGLEVLFSDGYPDPHGEPGLLCYQCGNKLGLEDIDGGYNDRI